MPGSSGGTIPNPEKLSRVSPELVSLVKVLEAFRKTTMHALRYTQIFVPGGLPDYTYITRAGLRLEDRLREAFDNLCKLVVVTGQTKSGKTVLARRVFSKDTSVWIDGGGIGSEEEFWNHAGEQLDAVISKNTKKTKGGSSSLSGKASGQTSFFFFKGTGEASATRTTSSSTETQETRTSSNRTAALKALASKRTPLVIDDFHYIPRDMQASLVRSLKSLVFDGVPVIFIAIPHRRYDSVKVEREMTGRIDNIQVPTWEEKELAQIATTGFNLLNVAFEPQAVKELSEQAIGSPHLMQEFCREICRTIGIEGTRSVRERVQVCEHMNEIFRKVSDNTGRSMFDKLGGNPVSVHHSCPKRRTDTGFHEKTN